MPRHLFVIAFLAGAVLTDARSQAMPGSGKEAGLPAGGGLDAARVVELRYGKAGTDHAGGAGVQARQDRISGALATLVFEDTGKKDQENVPVTFGQVFGEGVLKRTDGLLARLADGSTVPLQTDVKARHPDGSVRHAIISLVLARSSPAKPVLLGLFKGSAAPARAAVSKERTLSTLLQQGMDTRVELQLDERVYTANLRALLEKTQAVLWLDGPIAREWQVTGPLADADGRAHPHLAARFALRWYPALDKARVDVTVENNWAFEPAPQNFTYDAQVIVGDTEVYSKQDLTHYHHARWRKLFWWGGAPSVHVRHDTRQLIESMALPNYDQSVVIDDTRLSRMHAGWSGPRTEPMGTGMAIPGMPNTGGRADIGLLPGWAAMYLLGMDRRARELTLGTADLAGSWSMHYRDRRTGLPVSVHDYPYMTRFGMPGDTLNPATGKRELFPACVRPDACKTPNNHDISHQPAFSYLPYLLTGDHYHLEELQFWAMYDVFASNPATANTARACSSPNRCAVRHGRCARSPKQPTLPRTRIR